MRNLERLTEASCYQILMKVITKGIENITDYGVFVDLGGMDGLIHVTDLSWERVNIPQKCLISAKT